LNCVEKHAPDDFGGRKLKMTRLNPLFSLIASSILSLVLASIADATVPRAFVSTAGSDTNPCSANQPCRSFNQALTVVQPGGEIIVQNSGGYSTGFTITQSVTIDAGGFNASVLSTSGTDLCTINAGPSDRVVLRGISFHGANVGNTAISVGQVGSLYIEDCSITEFPGTALAMQVGGNLFVTDTDVRKCTAGLIFETFTATPAHLVVENSRFAEIPTSAVSLQSGGTGAATGLLTNCTASLGEVGFEIAASSSGNVDMTLTNCRALGNTQAGLNVGAQSTGNATMRIANCVVTQNVNGIATLALGSGTASVIGTGPGTNTITGNGGGNTVGGSTTLQ
jgi:hypothetical protein